MLIGDQTRILQSNRDPVESRLQRFFSFCRDDTSAETSVRIKNGFGRRRVPGETITVQPQRQSRARHQCSSNPSRNQSAISEAVSAILNSGKSRVGVAL